MIERLEVDSMWSRRCGGHTERCSAIEKSGRYKSEQSKGLLSSLGKKRAGGLSFSPGVVPAFRAAASRPWLDWAILNS